MLLCCSYELNYDVCQGRRQQYNMVDGKCKTPTMIVRNCMFIMVRTLESGGDKDCCLASIAGFLLGLGHWGGLRRQGSRR